jgi:predicted transcriptional regulator
MSSVLEKRRELLALMRQLTLDAGSFTVHDLSDRSQMPRSTVQDWVNRLIEERCVILKEEQRGRYPARYAASSAMLSSVCKRIFTTVDGDIVSIYHECMSGGCAAYCTHHHRKAGGVVTEVARDGTLLFELARLGEGTAEIGLPPRAAVGVVGVRREGDYVIQHIRCTGGPAFSLTEMMAMAEGVENVDVMRYGDTVEGEVYTRALTHVIIGLDDTDSRDAGATFALAIALLQHLSKMPGIIPILHRVAMLYPGIEERTAGNSCSYIEIAAEPDIVDGLMERAQRFVSEESISGEWGLAMKTGFTIPDGLRSFGLDARAKRVSRSDCDTIAKQYGVLLAGGRGVVGALAAVALRGISVPALLDPAVSPG